MNVIKKISQLTDILYTKSVSKKFKHIGTGARISRHVRMLTGARFISVGGGTRFGHNLMLTAWSSYGAQKFNPTVNIGCNCSFGDRVHITAINQIDIGNHVLTGSNVLITDNSHGTSDYIQMGAPPLSRPLYSKGPIKIEDNVWLGDNVVILPGVTIGKGTIVGANTVVTKSVPSYSVVIGNPNRIINKQ